MTNQEIFEAAWYHYVEDEQPCAVNEDGELCHRNENGDLSPLGLILSPWWLDRDRKLRHLPVAQHPGHDGNPLVEELCEIHDEIACLEMIDLPACWRTALEDLAERWGLLCG